MEQQRLQDAMAGPDFYKAPADEIRARQARLVALQEEIDATMARWEQLMEKEAGGGS